MTNEVNDLLIGLRDGTVTLDEVARRFRTRSWPSGTSSSTANYTEIAKAELRDPDPYISGSFDDVTIAYQRGELSEEQYDVLAAAMAEAVHTQDAERNGAS
jgi:hypothetical protein